MIEQLTIADGLTQVGIGVRSGGRSIIEVFADSDGQWTVVQTSVNGVSCIMADGAEWHGGQKGSPL